MILLEDKRGVKQPNNCISIAQVNLARRAGAGDGSSTVCFSEHKHNKRISDDTSVGAARTSAYATILRRQIVAQRDKKRLHELNRFLLGGRFISQDGHDD